MKYDIELTFQKLMDIIRCHAMADLTTKGYTMDDFEGLEININCKGVSLFNDEALQQYLQVVVDDLADKMPRISVDNKIIE